MVYFVYNLDIKLIGMVGYWMGRKREIKENFWVLVWVLGG